MPLTVCPMLSWGFKLLAEANCPGYGLATITAMWGCPRMNFWEAYMTL